MAPSLYEELSKASAATGMTMAKLVRMGASRVIFDLNDTGRSRSMSEFAEHYKEID